MTKKDFFFPGRVVVGMSGGVDSSVAALILKEQRYDVHGLFMSNWEEDEEGYCTAAEDYQDARRVCEEIGIPLHKVSFAREYRERVFRYFLDEYAAGRTPNPDVLCNREIKFGVFFEYARRLGADMVATGHYARVVNRGPYLYRSPDKDKDQTYFLSAVDERAFERTLFPLGKATKKRVRQIARDHGFHNFDKKDSTGICFIGERPFQEFLSRYLPASPGDIRTPEGEVIGRHSGLMYYTLGQRQGLGIGGLAHHDDTPWYVAGKDMNRNVLIAVQGHNHPLLFQDRLRSGPVNWIGYRPEETTFRCTAKTRYRQADQACTVTIAGDGRCNVRFDSPQRCITPGQHVVFYRHGRCLGGAVIESAISSAAVEGKATVDAGAAEATTAL